MDGLAGGSDPELIRELGHTSAAALLDRVHHAEDPAVVERVLTLVDREGVEIIAELWSHTEPDSLPGVLWRLYLLRTWMRKQDTAVAHLWRIGEPTVTSASAIAGVNQAPTEHDIAITADSILAGAFTGDFAMALDRAAVFTDVVANGLRIEAHRMVARFGKDAQSGTDMRSVVSNEEKIVRAKAARLMHTASNLLVTAKVFHHGAVLWRNGKLE